MLRTNINIFIVKQSIDAYCFQQLNVLIITNEAPYATEKAYNALRLAIMTLQKEYKEMEIRVFLFSCQGTQGSEFGRIFA